MPKSDDNWKSIQQSLTVTQNSLIFVIFNLYLATYQHTVLIWNNSDACLLCIMVTVIWHVGCKLLNCKNGPHKTHCKMPCYQRIAIVINRHVSNKIISSCSNKQDMAISVKMHLHHLVIFRWFLIFAKPLFFEECFICSLHTKPYPPINQKMFTPVFPWFKNIFDRISDYARIVSANCLVRCLFKMHTHTSFLANS